MKVIKAKSIIVSYLGIHAFKVNNINVQTLLKFNIINLSCDFYVLSVPNEPSTSEKLPSGSSRDHDKGETILVHFKKWLYIIFHLQIVHSIVQIWKEEKRNSGNVDKKM